MSLIGPPHPSMAPRRYFLSKTLFLPNDALCSASSVLRCVTPEFQAETSAHSHSFDPSSFRWSTNRFPAPYAPTSSSSSSKFQSFFPPPRFTQLLVGAVDGARSRTEVLLHTQPLHHHRLHHSECRRHYLLPLIPPLELLRHRHKGHNQSDYF